MSRLPYSLTSLMTPEVKEKTALEVVTVHQLVESVKRDIESNYRLVHVIGEVSSFKPWRSGHWYFDLKDEFALLPCVMFRNLTTRVPFEVKDGLQIVVTAKVSVYALQSKIQLIVERIEPCGVGALALAFEQLKAKLEAEGLFSAARKKALTPFPRVVGIVTSPQGAALADMLRVLRQRMPSVRVVLSPCRVQGQGSAVEIASALQRLDENGECDVIIIGRGGGSLEDLWSFNDEALARVIAACQTPIVSAVGHETDFSISDFVADIRAATPTHAASSVVQDANEVQKLVAHQRARLHNATKAKVRGASLLLEKYARRLSDPRVLLMRANQRVDELIHKIRSIVQKKRSNRSENVQQLRRRLEVASPMSKVTLLSRRLKAVSQRFWMLQPKARLSQIRQKLEHREGRLNELIAQRLKRSRENLYRMVASLSAMSPLSVMGRGYAIIYKRGSGDETQVVTSKDQIASDEYIRVNFRDGAVDAKVLNHIEEDQNNGK